jgi:hypothetical protein
LTYWTWSEHPGGSPPEKTLSVASSRGFFSYWLSRILPFYSRGIDDSQQLPGEHGERVHLSSEKLANESKLRFPEHEFDVVISDLISVNRSVPDPRSFGCKVRK